MRDNCRILDQYLYDLFPLRGDLAESVRNLQIDDATKQGRTLTMQDLPYHTRDNAWLAQYVTYAIGQLREFNRDPENVTNRFAKRLLPYQGGATAPTAVVPLPNIAAYVATAPSFDKYRCRYEQALTKEYINCLTLGLQPAEATHAGIQNKHDYDQFFRCRVVQAMVDVGIDRHSIEVSLETNAELWRDQAMVRAFKNTYHAELDQPNLCRFLIDQHPELFQSLIQWREIRAKHQKLWLKHREYAYYQKHHAIIDELGLATPNMLLTPDQAKRLGQNLRHMDRLHQKMRAKFQQAAATKVTLGQPAPERQI